MELPNDLNRIKEATQQFQANTMFLANYLRCNLATRARLSPLINETGEIEGAGLKVLVDYNMEDLIGHIGMGQGPTYSIVQF
jgi:hypothetical protein